MFDERVVFVMLQINEKTRHQLILGLIAFVITFAIYNFGSFST